MVSLEPAVVEVSGRRVRSRVAGEGPPVVLVHGLAGSWRWWRGIVPALAERHRVHLVDLPRLGPVWPGRLRAADASGWLALWLEAAALGPAALVGHSLGGLLTARLAAERPDLVAQLVLVAPAGVPSGRSATRYGGPLLEALRTAPPRFRNVLVADALRAGPAALLAGGLHATRADVRAELGRIEAPTLILWGGRDPVLPVRLLETWREHLPDAEVELLAHAGHVPMVDDPPGFADALRRFLAAEE